MEEWRDEIVEEIRAVREAYAQRFNYDVRAVCEDLQRSQAEGKRKIVRPSAEPVGTEGSNPRTAA
jgi:hypothetical protein